MVSKQTKKNHNEKLTEGVRLVTGPRKEGLVDKTPQEREKKKKTGRRVVGESFRNVTPKAKRNKCRKKRP